ncbi:glutamine amidotransferase [Roseateles sp. BYS87W]|uniref:Glutamine amidotransferase n=1 Tax=Pelomonas baiyunensis TaxID=3299026 RepID=A0ABW7H0D6_9BURK
MRTVWALRHLAFEDLGLLQPWFTRRGWQVQTWDAALDDLQALDPLAPDLLVVLGGPIGAGDDDRYPWLLDELALIRRRLAAQRPVLGICLGAQLMARAAGAAVAPMRTPEIGFSPLTLTPAGLRSPLAPLAGQPVLHWHGDQFALPAGSPALATTTHCPHQAFMVGAYAMAWQFHLEVDAARLEAWLVGHAGELRQAGIDLPTLRRDAARHGAGLAQALDAVMTGWLAQLGWA